MNVASLLRLSARGTAILLLGCTATPGGPNIYKLYPGPARPGSELAIVRMGDAAVAEFDGRPVRHGDWTEVHLLPGEHAVRWATEFGVSALVDARLIVTGGEDAQVTLAAGHVYWLKADRTKGPGYRMYFWIWDETGRQVIAGTPPLRNPSGQD